MTNVSIFIIAILVMVKKTQVILGFLHLVVRKEGGLVKKLPIGQE